MQGDFELVITLPQEVALASTAEEGSIEEIEEEDTEDGGSQISCARILGLQSDPSCEIKASDEI